MASACDPSTNPCGGPNCPATLDCLWRGNSNSTFPAFGMIALVINGTLIFVGTVSVAMIIYAGFKYISSQADKKAIDSANKTLFYAAIGLSFVLFSFLIINIIGSATGVTCIEPQNVLQKGFQACQ